MQHLNICPCALLEFIINELIRNCHDVIAALRAGKCLRAQKKKKKAMRMRMQVYLLGAIYLNVASLELQLHLIFWTWQANGNITDMIDDNAWSFSLQRVFCMTGSVYLYLT